MCYTWLEKIIIKFFFVGSQCLDVAMETSRNDKSVCEYDSFIH